MAEKLLLQGNVLKTKDGSEVHFCDLILIFSKSYVGPEADVSAGLVSEQFDEIVSEAVATAQDVRADYYLIVFSDSKKNVRPGSIATANFYLKRTR